MSDVAAITGPIDQMNISVNVQQDMIKKISVEFAKTQLDLDMILDMLFARDAT